MKKLLLFICMTLLLSGCSKTEITTSTFMQKFKDAKIPVVNIVTYTEKTDKNNLLGRPNQYVAKVNWDDDRTKKDGKSAGGTIEIFKNNEDLENRKKYVESISKKLSIVAQYIYANGNCLLRLDKELTPDQANEYKKIFEQK